MRLITRTSTSSSSCRRPRRVIVVSDRLNQPSGPAVTITAFTVTSMIEKPPPETPKCRKLRSVPRQLCAVSCSDWPSFTRDDTVPRRPSERNFQQLSE